MQKVKWIGLIAVAGLMLLATTVTAAEKKEPAKPDTATVEKAAPGGKIEVQDATAEAKQNEYWIGILCSPTLPEELRTHLQLPEKQGLLVREVVPKGPAAKAGLEPMDVLLKVNGKPIGSIAELVTAVEESKGKELAVDVLRKGKPETLKVIPEKRPADLQARHPATSDQPELQRIYEWFERMHPGWGGKPPMRLRFFHPGVMLPPDAPMHPALPEGMSINIMKQGSEPTKITVQKDGKTWEVTEKELDKLPADVRPFVDRMLEGMVIGPDVASPRFDFVPDWATPGKNEPSAKTDEGVRSRLEERLDKMNQRMEQLQKSLDNLRNKAEPEQEK